MRSRNAGTPPADVASRTARYKQSPEKIWAAITGVEEFMSWRGDLKSVERLPISNETRRYARTLLSAKPPPDDSPREIYRFRRATEPWALEALAFLGATQYADRVHAAREREPQEPLLRGDELGILPGPEVGRLLQLVEEERAAGTISTREEALELVRRTRR